MNGKKLLEKWTRKIQKNDVGNEAAIGQTLQAAIADVRRTSLPFCDFLQVMCKLWAVAVLHKQPRTSRDAIEAGMLTIWEDLLREQLRAVREAG